MRAFHIEGCDDMSKILRKLNHIIASVNLHKLPYIFIFFIVTTLLQACSTSIPAADNQINYVPPSYNKGINYLHEQNYNAAYRQLLPLAVHGDANALYAVGYLYYYGKGVDQNYELADSWISRAAAHRQPQALQVLNIVKHAGTAKSPQDIPAPI